MNVSRLASSIYITVAIIVIKTTTGSNKMPYRKHKNMLCMDVSPARCTHAKTKVLSQFLFTHYQKEMTLLLSEILPKSGHWDITHLILWKDTLGQATPLEAGREPKGSPRLNACPRRSHSHQNDFWQVTLSTHVLNPPSDGGFAASCANSCKGLRNIQSGPDRSC